MKKIVVFGSVNIDHVYLVDHFVSPGETISSTEFGKNWGGKGLNQAIAVSKAGGRVCLAAKVGLTEYDELCGLCIQANLDCSLVMPSQTHTGHAIIQVDKSGQNGIFVFPGANGTVSLEDIERVVGSMREGDFLLLQNEINSVPEIIERARSRRVAVALNPSPVSLDMTKWPLQYVDIMIINETEGLALTGEEMPEKILDSLESRCPDCGVVLTLGERGSMFRGGKRTVIQAAYPVRVVDTTAAGDTFTGYFLSSLISGSTPGAALKIASKAASIAVSRKGAAASIPTIDEVKQ